MVAKRDTNHDLVPEILKHRMGGYYKDENGVHYAFCNGLLISAYDMHKAGRGFTDWLVAVSWLTVYIEIKNLKGRGRRYTPSEEIFNLNNNVISRTFTEGEQIYEFLKMVVQLVNDLEDIISQNMPASYIETFFPKVSGLMIKSSSEEHETETKKSKRGNPAQPKHADNGGILQGVVSSDNGQARQLLIQKISEEARAGRRGAHRHRRR